jgi:Phage integrase family
LQIARAELQFDWVFCFDADERVTGNLRAFANGLSASDCDGVRIRLFDAYMTPDDFAPYQPGRELLGFRRFFGPEERDILMLWRNRPEVYFAEQHAREPGGMERLRTDLQCQHYGKSLSIEHWEETCDYYIRRFPFDTYGRKWHDRKGRAGHQEPPCSASTLLPTLGNRWGHRDATAMLIAYRHGLRASELVAMRWDDIDLTTGRLHVRRAKGGLTSVHPIGAKESRALRRLQRETQTPSPYVFVSERGAPLSVAGYQRMVARSR